MAVAAATTYHSLDSFPEIFAERERVREEAWALIAQRTHQMDAGHESELPPVIDALSTAKFVLEAKHLYGVESAEYAYRLAGLDNDNHRLAIEWYRKLRPVYFPVRREEFDVEAEDFYSHGLSARQRTENALRPILGETEEVSRRVNEKVEDETPHIVRRVGTVALAGAKIRTISECTDSAIEAYEHDQAAGLPHRGYGGMVPEIKKFMIRDMSLDDANGARLQEQLGLPGISLDGIVIRETLRRGDLELGEDVDKTRLHGTQILANDDLMEFAFRLDEVGGELKGVNLFMGEEVPADFVKDYANFRAESLRQQAELVNTARTISSFVLDLAEDGFDVDRAADHVEAFVKKLMLEIGRKDLSVAAQMFDEKTAQGLYEVNRLYEQGRSEEAFSLFQEVERMAPGGGYCSGGSCGLELVDIFSKSGEEVKEKLKAEKGDTIVKDNERKCKCGAKGVVYAYNANKVNKYCTGCGAFESKRTSVKAA